MKFEGSKSRRGYRKALAIVGTMSIGATLLIGALQINTASAAATHQGCKSLKPPQYFDNGAHYYKVYKPGNTPDAIDRDDAIVCTKTDITAVGGDLSKSPNAPDGAPAPAGAPAHGGAVHKGCGKTVEPWYFKDAAHWYSENPKPDYSNAHLCTTDDIKAAGGNPKVGDNGVIGPVGGGPAQQGTDTASERQQGGSKTNPFPADVSLNPAPNGCQRPVADGAIRVWVRRSNMAYYECDKRQINDKSPEAQAQGTDPTSDPGPAAANTDQAKIQDIAFRGYKWALDNKVSIRKANFNDACPPGYTVKDSDRTTDITWSAPNNGNWCNLVKWPIFYAGALHQGNPGAVSASISAFSGGAVS